jgi:hypothetical protein
MKMTEFRSQQPLNDDDFAAIRRNVMTTIVARRERRLLPVMMRFALAAAVVIAIIGLALVLRRPSLPTGVAIRKPATVIPTAPAPVVASAAVPQPITPVAHRLRHQRVHPQSVVAMAAQQNIRVEFRTSDPDIRIIWIASQTPNTTGGKS